MQKTADVIVIGAGLAGASLTWHLSSKARVLLLEQGDRPAIEASAQNAGMVRRLIEDPDERRLACDTRNWLTSDSDAGGASWRAVDKPFERTGAFIAFRDVESVDYRRHSIAADDLRAQGVDVVEIDHDRLAEAAPAFAGENAGASGGFWIPDEGVCDARALCQGLVERAQRAGATFSAHQRVAHLLRSGDRIIGVAMMDGTRLHAAQVVIATAAWTDHLTAGETQATLTPLGRHLFLTETSPLAQNHPWCWIEDEGLYIRPERGRFLVSPCDEFEVPIPDGPGSQGRPDLAVAELTQARMQSAFPALAGLKLHDGWTGLRTFAPHRRPVLGPDAALRGLFWCTGLGGSGVSTAIGLGARAAGMLGSGETGVDAASSAG